MTGAHRNGDHCDRADCPICSPQYPNLRRSKSLQVDCNIQLRAYQSVLPQISALGARLVAISPQLPDNSLDTVNKNTLTFDVLSDVGSEVARSYGLVYSLPDEIRAALRSNNKALPSINGDESWELPVPATYVIARDRLVALAYIEVDYRKRLEPEALLRCLKSLS
jgi:peroxiredoxin